MMAKHIDIVIESTISRAFKAVRITKNRWLDVLLTLSQFGNYLLGKIATKEVTYLQLS